MSDSRQMKVEAAQLAAKFANLRVEGMARIAAARQFFEALTDGVGVGNLEAAIMTETTVHGAIELAKMYGEFLNGPSAPSS